jgi:hypothetical protein
MGLGNSTTNVTLQLTGTSSVPNNFNIEIFAWNITTDSVSTTGRTYASAVSRTTTSSLNGGTLLNGYGISGITGTDRYVKLTSTTTCTSDSGLISIESAALSVYVPPNGSNYSAPGAEDTFTTQGPSNYLSSGVHNIASFDSLSYISASDFTVSYLSGTTVSGAVYVTGTYQHGPFSSLTVVQSGKSFSVNGSPNTSFIGDASLHILGRVQLTYTPSGKSTTFDYYYRPWTT